ncbi:MAG: exosortase/archaeosortase family protein [Campylobacterota bacterium]|nr:exosortase/archaeosortase family protein [Campylobacterota bacterium]
MKQFIGLYLFFLLLFYIVFYAHTSIVSIALNEAQTNLTLFLLNIFLSPGQLQGQDIIISPVYKIIINQACNGMIPIIFLFASIAAYPAPLLSKLFWMLLGYVIFLMVNVIRILFVVAMTEQGEGQVEFYWSHDIVGNALLMITGLALFVTFIKTSPRKLK